MKKRIQNRIYDTETAKLIAEWQSGENYRDLYYCEESLYQKKTGEYFLHGASGAAGKYSEQVDCNHWKSGEAIVPLTYEEAREWMDEHMRSEP